MRFVRMVLVHIHKQLFYLRPTTVFSFYLFMNVFLRAMMKRLLLNITVRLLI